MKMHQISEDDLSTLESVMPELIDVIGDRLDNRLRAKARRIQQVLQRVRWNYGPHTDVETMEGGDAT